MVITSRGPLPNEDAKITVEKLTNDPKAMSRPPSSRIIACAIAIKI
ncbi:hypothetical protein AGMMS49944_24580 [Spirochaetia bacterium]|nr:hypothetical protein AGMMS49944_24580 [Spirochaetia bacterium]